MPATMTHRERAITALECRGPDRIPTFELEYQLRKNRLDHIRTVISRGSV